MYHRKPWNELTNKQKEHIRAVMQKSLELQREARLIMTNLQKELGMQTWDHKLYNFMTENEFDLPVTLDEAEVLYRNNV